MRAVQGVAVLLLIACGSAQAEFRAVVGRWDYDLSGFVVDRGETYDFERDLGVQATGRRSVRLELGTPEGWPDLAASFTELGARGQREESFDLESPLLPLPIESEPRRITSDADFDDLDLTARVPLQWGPAAVALGLTAKRLRGTVLIDDSDQPAPRRQEYDEVFPQLHADLRWPVTGFLALNAGLQGISYQGSRAVEWRAAVELRLLRRLLLEAGWQKKGYEITVGDDRLDATLDGALLRFGFLLD